jgi:hypothetical protein
MVSPELHGVPETPELGEANVKDRLCRSLLYCALVLVAAFAINVLVLPMAHSQAPSGSKFGGLVVTGGVGPVTFFDPKTGDIWCYTPLVNNNFEIQSFKIQHYGKLEELGKPLVRP